MKKILALSIVVAASAFIGCGGDNGTEPPGDIIVLLDPENDTISLGDSLEFTAGVFNTTNTGITWYVNDIENGNSEVGTIVDPTDSSGIYVAPSVSTSSDTARVRIVSQVDPSKSDASRLLILDPIFVYVDSATGDDATGTGSAVRPFRTITHGLNVAQLGQIVRVSQGTYSEATGEAFPLAPRFGISVRGTGVTQTRVFAPSGIVAVPAFQIRHDLVSIRELSIIGAFEGIGVEFAGTSDTSRLAFQGNEINGCFQAAVSTGTAHVVRFDSCVVVNCTFGFDVAGDIDSVFILANDFTGVNTAVRLNSLGVRADITGNNVNGAINGFLFDDSSNVFAIRNTFTSIDSISIYIRPHSFANLGQIAILGDNVFNESGTWCIFNADDDSMTAIGNTWLPAADSATIDSQRIYDDDENATSGKIIFMPKAN